MVLGRMQVISTIAMLASPTGSKDGLCPSDLSGSIVESESINFCLFFFLFFCCFFLVILSFSVFPVSAGLSSS